MSDTRLIKLLLAAFVVGTMLSLPVRPALAETVPALLLPNAQKAPMVALTQAGVRLVAAGDHGVILLSDDGQSWRQARSVPVDSLLTELTFTDSMRGWAVGHDGVILSTADGGETWSLQQLEERPVLLSILMSSDGLGFVSGAYGYAARTTDGGKSWKPFKVNEQDDYHLNKIFLGPERSIYIAAEAGQIYRSYDSGLSWKSLNSGVDGSLWTGQALRDGRIILAGMSGRLMLSDDKGETWQKIAVGEDAAITDVSELPDGRIAIIGNGGLVGVSNSRLTRFDNIIRSDRQGLAAMFPLDGLNIVFAGSTGVGVQELPR